MARVREHHPAAPVRSLARVSTLPPTAARLRQAAFELFEQQGYEATTVDQIADRAGVGRSTFFRTFGSKEDVIFPEHSAVLSSVGDRLAAAGRRAATDPAVVPEAAADAARIVLRHYLAEGEVARARYRLTRSIPLLRAREIAQQQQYMQEFRAALRTWTGEPAGADLRAELMAASIVVGHNHVLRRWLRGAVDDAAAEAELDEAMALVTSVHRRQAGANASTVLVIGSDQDPAAVAASVRRALAAEQSSSTPE